MTPSPGLRGRAAKSENALAAYQSMASGYPLLEGLDAVLRDRATGLMCGTSSWGLISVWSAEVGEDAGVGSDGVDELHHRPGCVGGWGWGEQCEANTTHDLSSITGNHSFQRSRPPSRTARTMTELLASILARDC